MLYLMHQTYGWDRQQLSIPQLTWGLLTLAQYLVSSAPLVSSELLSLSIVNTTDYVITTTAAGGSQWQAQQPINSAVQMARVSGASLPPGPSFCCLQHEKQWENLVTRVI